MYPVPGLLTVLYIIKVHVYLIDGFDVLTGIWPGILSRGC